MSDWKPEVGQKCLLEDVYGCANTVEVTGKGKHGWLVCKVGCSGEGYVPNEKAFFKPIQNEADKQRDEQVSLIKQGLRACGLEVSDITPEFLYREKGCRIIAPDEYVVKPLTDEQIDKLTEGKDLWRDDVIAVQRELGVID